ncbi:hypothetical protein KCU65_g9570, partial [Aureobasidium melanogenum]
MSSENVTSPAEAVAVQKTGLAVPIPSSPTRILLRLPVKEWEDWVSYPAAIEACLDWANLSVQDYRERKHNIFVEALMPLDLPHVPQKRFHVAIDLYARSYDVKDMKDVEHKIYTVRRDPEGNITVGLPRPERHVAHILRGTREVTDEKWFWGGAYVLQRAALPAPSSPTRILLRLPKKEWVWESHRDAIVAYLNWSNRSVKDFEQGKHECYVEFKQDPEVPQKRYHIAIDLYALSYEVKDMKDVRDGKDVEHEIYTVRRNSEGQITVHGCQPPVRAENIIREMRKVTDESWPWRGEHPFRPAYSK